MTRKYALSHYKAKKEKEERNCFVSLLDCQNSSIKNVHITTAAAPATTMGDGCQMAGACVEKMCVKAEWQLNLCLSRKKSRTKRTRVFSLSVSLSTWKFSRNTWIYRKMLCRFEGMVNWRKMPSKMTCTYKMSTSAIKRHGLFGLICQPPTLSFLCIHKLSHTHTHA